MANLLLSIYKGANQIYHDYVFADKTPHFSLLKENQTLAYITSLVLLKRKLNQ